MKKISFKCLLSILMASNCCLLADAPFGRPRSTAVPQPDEPGTPEHFYQESVRQEAPLAQTSQDPTPWQPYRTPPAPRWYDQEPAVNGNQGAYQEPEYDEEEQPCCHEYNLHYGPALYGATFYEAEGTGVTGVWLPEDPVLFRQFIADPRAVTYSVGWRFNDQALVKNVIDVSYGDSIAFYRWCDIGPWCGQLQIELEGALWAVFDPLHDSSPLINADYYVGVPVTYAFDNWSFRLRGYHISSHIGDEYLLNHPHFDRRNPSAEFLDFYVSNDMTDEIRLYGGIGVVVAQDDSFRCGRFYAEAGVEIHMPQFGFINEPSQVYGMPFYAMDFRYQTKEDKHLNQTYALGYEWGKLFGLERKVRLYLEYHDGYSYEGQFCCIPTNYLSIRLSYGF